MLIQFDKSTELTKLTLGDEELVDLEQIFRYATYYTEEYHSDNESLLETLSAWRYMFNMMNQERTSKRFVISSKID